MAAVLPVDGPENHDNDVVILPQECFQFPDRDEAVRWLLEAPSPASGPER
jgi:hypothetical protein